MSDKLTTVWCLMMLPLSLCLLGMSGDSSVCSVQATPPLTAALPKISGPGLRQHRASAAVAGSCRHIIIKHHPPLMFRSLVYCVIKRHLFFCLYSPLALSSHTVMDIFFSEVWSEYFHPACSALQGGVWSHAATKSPDIYWRYYHLWRNYPRQTRLNLLLPKSLSGRRNSHIPQCTISS